jgi:hypothetical protein
VPSFDFGLGDSLDSLDTGSLEGPSPHMWSPSSNTSSSSSNVPSNASSNAFALPSRKLEPNTSSVPPLTVAVSPLPVTSYASRNETTSSSTSCSGDQPSSLQNDSPTNNDQVPCDNFRVDLAAPFGMCMCGHAKKDHHVFTPRKGRRAAPITQPLTNNDTVTSRCGLTINQNRECLNH